MIVFLPISVNIGQCAFEALAQIVHKIHSLGDMNHDKHGRSSLLSSYVSYAFNTPGSGTPVPSPNDSPSKFIQYVAPLSPPPMNRQVPYGAKLCQRNFRRVKLIVGRNFPQQRKKSTLSPDKNVCTIKIIMSVLEVQVNLRGKQIIQTIFD